MCCRSNLSCITTKISEHHLRATPSGGPHTGIVTRERYLHSWLPIGSTLLEIWRTNPSHPSLYMEVVRTGPDMCLRRILYNCREYSVPQTRFSVPKRLQGDTIDVSVLHSLSYSTKVPCGCRVMHIRMLASGNRKLDGQGRTVILHSYLIFGKLCQANYFAECGNARGVTGFCRKQSVETASNVVR